jgi:hypothetical protein
MARLKYKIDDATYELDDPDDHIIIENSAPRALSPAFATKAQLHFSPTTMPSQAREHAAEQAQFHAPSEISPLFGAEAELHFQSIQGAATADASSQLALQLDSSVSLEEAQEVQLLNPASQPRFVNELPLPQHIDASRPGAFVLQMGQTEQWLGLVDASGDPLVTTVWGYGQPGQTPTYPGPTIVAYEGTAIKMNWQNDLPLAAASRKHQNGS